MDGAPQHKQPDANTINNIKHTPPESPTQILAPRSSVSTTPLHQRYLQEVKMRPTPTPPRTPSPHKQHRHAHGPSSCRSTPAKVSSRTTSPTKQQLEIGPNAFYFSCELPMSKITPKKNATPAKATPMGTPKRGSPLKALAQGSVRQVQSTPTERVEKEKSERGTPIVIAQDGNGSPNKATQKGGSIAPEFCLMPTTTPQDSPTKKEVGKNSTTKVERSSMTDHIMPSSVTTNRGRASSKAQRVDIGHLMAGLGSGGFTTFDWTHGREERGKAASPTPTPLRRASQKLRPSISPSFLRLNTSSTQLFTDEDSKSKDNQQLLPDSQLIRPSAIQDNFNMDARQMQSLSHTPECSPSKLQHDGNTRITAMDYQPTSVHDGDALSAKEKNCEGRSKFVSGIQTAVNTSGAALTLTQQSTAPDAQHKSTFSGIKNVKWKDEALVRPSHRRTGTDPEVLLAIQREMVATEASMRRSAGLPLGTLNTSQLPAMASSKVELDQSSTLGTVEAQVERKKEARTSANTSSRGTGQTSMSVSVQKKNTSVMKTTSNRLAELSKPKNPRDVHPLRKKQPNRAVTETSKSASLLRSPQLDQSRRRSSVKKTGVKSNRVSTLKIKPLKTRAPPYGKSASTIPLSACRSIFDMPEPTRPSASSKARTMRPSSTSSHAKTIHTSRDKQNTKKPANSSVNEQPTFVDALTIAARISSWNAEEDEASDPKSEPNSKFSTKSLPNTTTPLKPSSLAPPPTIKTPKLSPPKTPAPKALSHRTPRSSPFHDPNAHRTPSRKIQSSLDAAIDAHKLLVETPAKVSPQFDRVKTKKRDDAVEIKTPAKRMVMSGGRKGAKGRSAKGMEMEMGMFDRGAYRTPSKEIEGSLGEAIDRFVNKG